MRAYRALRSRLRSSDVLGRIGGDEFAALVLHVDEDGGAAGRRRRCATRSPGWGWSWRPRAGRTGWARASASRRCRSDDPRDVAALIDLADQRMYLEKRSRRR